MALCASSVPRIVDILGLIVSSLCPELVRRSDEDLTRAAIDVLHVCAKKMRAFRASKIDQRICATILWMASKQVRHRTLQIILLVFQS